MIESTDSCNKSSGSTTSDKSVQSTSTSNIQTTNNDAADNKSKSQSNGRLNLLYQLHFESDKQHIKLMKWGNLKDPPHINKSKSQSYKRLNISFCFIHSLFNNYM